MVSAYKKIASQKTELLLRGWSKSRRGGGGPEENGGWVSKFRALAKGGSSQFSASGGMGHDSFGLGVIV